MAEDRPTSGDVSPMEIFGCTAPMKYARRREGGMLHRRLSELLDAVGGERLRFKDADVRGIACDSRNARAGWLFVAIPGTRENGASYVEDAVARGAAAVVCEGPAPETKVPVCVVRDARAALADIAARFYQDPTERLNVIGVTGTKGKTTTAWLLASIFDSAGRRAGLFGTVLNRIGEEILPAANTTPGPLEMEAHLRRLADRGGTHAVMEVSSHGIAQNRIAGIEFRCGVFTNLAPEHLDYHGTMERYLAAKASFFERLAPEAVAVLPRAEAASAAIARRTGARIAWYG
ncbi:MAG: hypothetical protein HYY17_10755, partial [Planctomycetes bacterium]|nr:hypothetical protein [Planctomycetota bacterium]